MERLGYVWRSLERHIPENILEKIVGMRFTKDRQVNKLKNSRYCCFLLFSHCHKFVFSYIQGAAFDVPSEFDSVIMDRWTNGKFDSLEKATELPECEEVMSDRRQSGGYGNRGRSGQGFGRGERKFGNGWMFSNTQRGSRGGFGGDKHGSFNRY